MTDTPDDFSFSDNEEWGEVGQDPTIYDPFANDQTTKDVLGEIGIDGFEKLFFTDKFINDNPESVRQNSFGSVADMVIWLYDTGLISFGGIYKKGDEYVPVIENETDKRRKK